MLRGVIRAFGYALQLVGAAEVGLGLMLLTLEDPAIKWSPGWMLVAGVGMLTGGKLLDWVGSGKNATGT